MKAQNKMCVHLTSSVLSVCLVDIVNTVYNTHQTWIWTFAASIFKVHLRYSVLKLLLFIWADEFFRCFFRLLLAQ